MIIGPRSSVNIEHFRKDPSLALDEAILDNVGTFISIQKRKEIGRTPVAILLPIEEYERLRRNDIPKESKDDAQPPRPPE